MSVYTDLNLVTTTDEPLAEDIEAVRQSVLAILNTSKGERVFRPDFGNTIEDYLFELIDQTTALDLFRRLVNDINSQEPRVSVNLSNTTITPDPIKGVFQVFLVLDLFGLSESRLQFSGTVSN